MKTIKLEIPREDFEKFTTFFNGEKEAIDYIELKVDTLLRKDRYAIRPQSPKDKKEIEIYILDYLYPIVPLYEAREGISISQKIANIIKRKVV